MQNLDLERLTLGEVATIEDLSGQSISTVGDDGVPMGKMLGALCMITKRRNGFPAFKFGDALALTMDEALEVLGWTDDDDTATEAPAAGDAPEQTEAPEARPTKASKAKSPTPN